MRMISDISESVRKDGGEHVPTNEERLLTAVTAAPHDDAPRKAYADYIRPFDPDRAELIDLQLERAADARTTRMGHRGNPGERGILSARGEEWSRTLLKYVRRAEYYRGFVERIVIDPYLFLEYGEWLYINAPIHYVAFARPADGPFPIDELAASPLLARLTGIGLSNGVVDDATVARFASSPHLTSCQWLDLSYNVLTIKAFESLAHYPSTRKLLAVARDQGGHWSTQYDPGQQLEVTDRRNRWDGFETEWGPIKPEAQALERQYGYLPWLHHENTCFPLDAHWYVTHGVLPVKPVGSPVE